MSENNEMIGIKEIIGENPVIPVCKATFYKLIRVGIVPKPVYIGNKSYWDKKEIERIASEIVKDKKVLQVNYKGEE